MHSVPAKWPIAIGDPREADPSDEELLRWARDGRVLTSLVFWTGATREGENLYALKDIVARTGVLGGVALTAQSFGWRPAPLDLLIWRYSLPAAAMEWRSNRSFPPDS